MERNEERAADLARIDRIHEQLETALGMITELKKLSEKEERVRERAAQRLENARHIYNLPFRVIHLHDNPLQRQVERHRREAELLRIENNRIKARLELIESGNENDVTRRIDDAVSSAEEVETLKKKLTEYEQRETKIMSAFKKTSREFREVCYLLTGYRIDALKDRIYRLSNMYSSNEEDVIMFRIESRGEIELLDEKFPAEFTKHVDTYLKQYNSYPAFLSAITLQLFNSTTQVFQESMNISKDETVIQKQPATRQQNQNSSK